MSGRGKKGHINIQIGDKLFMNGPETKRAIN